MSSLYNTRIVPLVMAAVGHAPLAAGAGCRCAELPAISQTRLNFLRKSLECGVILVDGGCRATSKNLKAKGFRYQKKCFQKFCVSFPREV